MFKKKSIHINYEYQYLQTGNLVDDKETHFSCN